jgi:hypothetical protein
MSCFLDSPELAPGAMPGASGTTISPSSIAARVTSSLFSEPSSIVNPTSPSSSTSQSSSNTVAIIGGAVGGVVAISLVIAIGFFLRRRRPEVPGTGAPPTAGASRPPMDEIQRPLTMHDGYTTSSIPVTVGSSMPGTPATPMRDVRVSHPISRRAHICAHRMRFLAHSFFFFDTQDPNYPSTLPGYQGVPQTPITPPQGAIPSHNETGNSLATMQTSLPQGYHGLPIV